MIMKSYNVGTFLVILSDKSDNSENSDIELSELSELSEIRTNMLPKFNNFIFVIPNAATGTFTEKRTIRTSRAN